jgi:transforming growth factor-beta-induced protein
MTTTGLFRSFFFVFSLGALVACDSSDNNNASTPETPSAGSPDDTPGTIVEIAQENGNFETLVTALEAAGLDSTLADENGEFTVFAPTDDAFAALPEGTLDALLADTDLLTDILLYHVISDSVVGSETALSLAGSTQLMANESKLAITVRGDALYLNESMVIDTDIEASNGVIHVIDAVLTPINVGEPEGSIVDIALASPDLTTLVAALQAADLVGTLADETATFTVFAPTDDAFAVLGEDAINALLADPASLSDVLLYHVIVGAAADKSGKKKK